MKKIILILNVFLCFSLSVFATEDAKAMTVAEKPTETSSEKPVIISTDNRETTKKNSKANISIEVEYRTYGKNDI